MCVDTWYKARLHAVNLDSVDTESTGERISPLVLTDEQSKRHTWTILSNSKNIFCSTLEDDFARICFIYIYIKTHLFLIKLRLFLFAEVAYSRCREEKHQM